MIGLQFGEGMFIDFANINFECPNCGKKYCDENDKYLNRCNKNKSGITKINCSCGNPFFMTYDYKGDAQSFIIKH